MFHWRHSAYVLKLPLNGREILDSGNPEQIHHQRDLGNIHDRPKDDSQKMVGPVESRNSYWHRRGYGDRSASPDRPAPDSLTSGTCFKGGKPFDSFNSLSGGGVNQLIEVPCHL